MVFLSVRLLFPCYRRNTGTSQKGSSLVDTIVNRFRKSERIALAITPEGTRSRTSNWRHGFLHIARQADVPILLGVIDYPTKRIMIDDEFTPTDDTDADMHAIKQFYAPFTGKYPDKFSTDDA